MIWIGKQIGILTARATHHRVSEGTGSTDGACVIDGNIEATETNNGPVDEVFDFVFVAHIGDLLLTHLLPHCKPKTG